MTKITETKICDVVDPSFQLMIAELCESVGLRKNEIINWPLSYLLMAIVRDKRKIDSGNVLISEVLDAKVGKLPLNSVVYTVCCELVRANGKHIECFTGKKVCTLIKETHKFYAPTSKSFAKRKQKRKQLSGF